MTTNEKLLRRMKSADTLVCVGLDPDYDKIPLSVKRFWRNRETVTFLFLKQVVDITATHCCSFKIQKAFFDLMPDGHKLLKRIIRYIHRHHPMIPIFIDCKIGDIDNTMRAYLANIFDELGADGIVVNPYMGDDVFAEIAPYAHKSVIVLVKTSNPNASIIQDYHDLWKHVLSQVVSRWNIHGNLIPVIASTSQDDLTSIRQTIPDEMPILFAGVGAQGGQLDSLKHLVDSDGYGVFVNSSRGLLYPYKPSDKNWRECIKQAVIALKNKLNHARRLL